MNKSEIKIAVIGLGYVGLPLAMAFGKIYNTIGFDINKLRVDELKSGVDVTKEFTADEIHSVNNLKLSACINDIKSCNCFIVTVPTPIDDFKRPDLSLLLSATKIIGTILKKNDIVIYESTVYPGCTEDDCVPVLEAVSALKYNVDFYCGYSPERINPGDKERKLETIKKVTSGSNPEIAEFVNRLYLNIIAAGTHMAETIRVAEAAKIIENTQRDLNIALINELALIFNRMGIDTEAVLRAAATKWNFLHYKPGLVGGHCIGVDPYYLTHKAQQVGYHPEVILSGRRLNDNMGSYVVSQLVKFMTKKRIHIFEANILLLGISFKENCTDLRNTRVVDIVKELNEYSCKIDVYDPWVDKKQCMEEHKIKLIERLEPRKYNAIIICVAHEQFILMGSDEIRKLLKENGIIYDLKWVLDISDSDLRL